ncbi:MAG: aminopeptidase [Xanthomonadales bacterium]|nr:aminopeptidase [Xanthomonadales bacterium]
MSSIFRFSAGPAARLSRPLRPALVLLAAVAAVQLGACASPAWYAQAVHGHFSLMSGREEVQALLASADTDPELARDLRLAVEVRDFAIAHLDLPDNASYTSLVRTGREAVTWNVVAAPEFSLQPKLWCFLVSGCVPYRGYFKREAAEHFAGKLADRGFDVTVAPAIAYSTLGWFDDPLVDTMFQAGAAGLAATVFHELAHQKLYVRGDTAFSEAYASFVETAGVRAWLQATGRQDALREWRRMERARRKFNDLLLETRQQLQALYTSGIAETAMREQKQALFENLRETYEHRVANDWNGRAYFGSWFRRDPSNASLALLQNYQGGVSAFERLYEEAGRDMRRFHALAAEKADLDAEVRKRWLSAIASSHDL